nr:MAG TPA: hypothetical protein [Caudoviricetes sp.]
MAVALSSVTAPIWLICASTSSGVAAKARGQKATAAARLRPTAATRHFSAIFTLNSSFLLIFLIVGCIIKPINTTIRC